MKETRGFWKRMQKAKKIPQERGIEKRQDEEFREHQYMSIQGKYYCE
jgi:hypothetical protein